MKIESIQKKHISRLVELVQIFKQEKDHPATSIPPELIEMQFTSVLETENSLILVAVDGDTVLGYIAGHFIDFPMLGGKECYISDLLVNPKLRSRGVGSALVSRIEDEAESRGCKRLMLNNLKSAVSYLRKFYFKKGFQERDKVANMIKTLN